MRSFLVTATLAATLAGGMALAQSGSQTTTVRTTVTQTGPEAPLSTLPRSPSAPMPAASDSVDQSSGSLDPAGVIRKLGPAQEIAENAPPATQSYPLCTRTLQDGCKNPDPARELPYYRPKN